jgi:hypothetical protein
MTGRRAIIRFAHNESTDSAHEKCDENEKKNL